jgi:hypothetical protein
MSAAGALFAQEHIAHASSRRRFGSILCLYKKVTHTVHTKRNSFHVYTITFSHESLVQSTKSAHCFTILTFSHSTRTSVQSTFRLVNPPLLLYR